MFRLDYYKCDEEILNHGTTLFAIHSLSSHEINDWVQEVANASKEKVDWRQFGGRAFILGMGDLDKIRRAMVDLLPSLNKMITSHHKSDDCSPQLYNSNDIYEYGQVNERKPCR